MKQEKILDKWQSWSGPFIRTDTYLETVYNDLTGSKSSGFVKHN
jgi:hypothetical protein